MKFTPTPLHDAHIVDLERREDERGFFARAFCAREFAEHSLNPQFVNANLSHNTRAGTLRGMHFQRVPHAEVKLVRCVRGAIFDVIVDLRSDSPSYSHWFGVELSADNGRALYIPEGFAHGFQTLEDDSDVLYHVSAFYLPEAEGGVRYNDPSFGIDWPLAVTTISPKDATWEAWRKDGG